MFTSAKIRSTFIDFFVSKGHTHVASSPLVPNNDPTLLFTNAGMVQFKDVFLGQDKRDYTRAVTAQRCVRAGGKHNDLDNVGYTARHHTFFEMLGNFSFGDYFKHDAIIYAWELLTQHYKLPAEKLWVTVYLTDDEAYNIWHQVIGVPAERIVRIGDNKGEKYASDNFWQMGNTGPCGPCSEIFYDHGPDVAGGPPGSPEEDGDRYIEIWNLVFMQFNRDESGTLHNLPKPSVDTGMGLERLAAVLQHVHSNYEIDLFRHLIQAAAKITGCSDLANNSLKVISDHIRACSFLIVDGILPSNEGRGYVLRRIMRRAIRHGYKLGCSEPFFHKLVPALVQEMGAAYPELAAQQKAVERAILQEEERFSETLERGMSLLDAEIANLKDRMIPGVVVFKLYDTYGFPSDLTADIARERNLTLDMKGFDQEMEQQRERGRASSTFAISEITLPEHSFGEFCGYLHEKAEGHVIALYQGTELAEQLQTGETGILLLDNTPFYAESGGQVGDTGVWQNDTCRFRVTNTRKIGSTHIHEGVLEQGQLKKGDRLFGEIDDDRRHAIRLNHSATHLMHAALRKVLGTHVQQKGSLVAPDRLRFDFSHTGPVTTEELAQVEALVNHEIRRILPVNTELKPMEEAVKSGAMALFGEKYADVVRVVQMGDFSAELCGGTHVSNTGEIGLFRIESEEGTAAGVRRIEASTGQAAWIAMNTEREQLVAIAHLLKTRQEQCAERVQQGLEQQKALEKTIQQLKTAQIKAQGQQLLEQAQSVKGIQLLITEIAGADAKTLREMVEDLKSKLGSCVILLGSASGEAVSLVAGVSKDQTAVIKAGELVNEFAAKLGGKGGGRPDIATAGAKHPERLATVLSEAQEWICNKL